MKKFKILLLLSLFGIISSNAQSFDNWEEYSIVPTQISVDGTHFVKVSGTGHNGNKAIKNAIKNALHSALISGIPSSTVLSGPYSQAIPATAPIIPSLNSRQIKYFKSFFKKKYLDFAVVYSDRYPSGDDFVFLHNGDVKVDVYVLIKYDELRHYLEEKGIISSLSSGF